MVGRVLRVDEQAASVLSPGGLQGLRVLWIEFGRQPAGGLATSRLPSNCAVLCLSAVCQGLAGKWEM